MYKFEDYSLIIYKTEEEYHNVDPKRKFVAFLREIPEASLHEYGKSQTDAKNRLQKMFSIFVDECNKNMIEIPPPFNYDTEKYSGKLVLRLPRWLHKNITFLSHESGESINSYIVNRLIVGTTFDDVCFKIQESNTNMLENFRYDFVSVNVSKSDEKVPAAKILDFNKYSYAFKKTGT